MDKQLPHAQAEYVELELQQDYVQRLAAKKAAAKKANRIARGRCRDCGKKPYDCRCIRTMSRETLTKLQAGQGQWVKVPGAAFDPVVEVKPNG